MSDNRKNHGVAFDKTIPFSFVNAVLVSLLLAVFFFVRFENKACSQTIRPVIDGKININQENAQSLARLPGIGVALADEIVAYRENASISQPNSLPFEKPLDLRNVRGIGPEKQKMVTPWIKFK